MQSIIISAPFGNYYNLFGFKNVTYTLGTFTARPRGWLDKPYGNRWARLLWTVRYSRSTGGWINKLGLKNPGIGWLCNNRKIDVSDKIVSIYGETLQDWLILLNCIKSIRPLACELNLSCPNIKTSNIEISALRTAQETGVPIIVKIPPVFYEPIVDICYSIGIKTFHCCNTLPTPYGGISGKPLIKISQGVVKHLRYKYPDIRIIGGGGITEKQDAFDYMNAGANYIALGTMLFNPLNWFKIKNLLLRFNP